MLVSRARRLFLGSAVFSALGVGACNPHVKLPVAPLRVPYAADSADVALARRLAPVLYVQRDEPFALRRVVAVVHPTRAIIAYHVLWNHDVNGQWVPWAKATDAEVMWVGYDRASGMATDLWTYWHGTVLHADWRGHGIPTVAVQWGKHGNLPYGVVESDLPKPKTLNFFYAAEWMLLPDLWLGKISHGGPWAFGKSYRRYREFTRVMPLSLRLDAVARSEDPRAVLDLVFGAHHADKRHWPPMP